MSGPFGSSQWMYASGGFYNNVATQSLRYNDDDNPYLSKTFSASNAKTWTWSGWVKLSSTTVSNSFIYSQLSSGADVSWLYFTSNNQLNMQNYEGGNQLDIMTNAKFRDTSAWYHIMAVLDTTQSTSTDRAKMYVNGELQTSLANTTYPSQNADLKFNNGDAPVLIGGTPDSYGTGEGYKLDGYLAEVNFIDGQALDPTSFGETKNGVWIPIEYTGSYGTNGFRLQFNQTGTGTASSSTIGADTSGNANHFTSSGIVASDCDMPDSPENNFATLNPLRHNISGSESDGNLRYVNTATSSEHRNYGTFGLTSGKFYWEGRCEGTNPDAQIGLGGVSETLTSNTYRISYKSSNGATVGLSGATYSTFGNGDIIGVAYDADNTQITFYKNNTAQTGSPVSITADTQGMFPMLMTYNEGSTSNSGWIMNFGQDSSFVGNETAQGNTDGNGNGDFYYSPPSGYLALCTANLPEPTISPNADTQADDYFNTVLHTANGTAGSFTGVGFQPDFVWAKSRNNAYGHELWDVVRGVNSTLFSQNNEKEDTSANRLVSFDSDGFSYGTAGNLYFSSNNSVAWNWKAGGTAVSNTDGSITSSVSANTDAGFSIVSYSGNATAGATVGHGLSSAPEMVIYKCRNVATQWPVYSTSVGASSVLFLESTGASVSSSVFNNTSPTSTNLVLGTDGDVNGSGRNYIAYCFHSVEGFSKFGSYIGNGSSTDGTFIYTGFRPAWLMVKVTNISGENWHMFDSERAPFNVVVPRLIADDSTAENNNDNILDFTSNGFKWRDSNAGYNGSGNSYIFMAFAENPFKYANAR